MWTGLDADGFGTISLTADFTYVDWLKTGRLMVRDLEAERVAAHEALVARTDLERRELSAISRDGTQVAYEWDTGAVRCRFCIAPLRGADFPNSGGCPAARRELHGAVTTGRRTGNGWRCS